MKIRSIIATAIALLAVPRIGPAAEQNPAWSVPSADTLPDTQWGRIVRAGRDLTIHTASRIGPEAPDPQQRFAGNNLSCGNCHLEAGTKPFGLPYVGVFADFPQYRPREGAIGTLEDRINGCMTRSLNGRKLPLDSAEMTAMVAYIKFLSSGVPIGQPIPGQPIPGRPIPGQPIPGRGAGSMKLLDRAADPAHGREVYARSCAICHGADGLGQQAGGAYFFPPLWGNDSFNDGAGMNRLISAANFIHSNMPNGATWNNPVLSPDDSWDVAAYIQAQPRPHMPGLEADFPIRSEKPVDAGYGPYADGFDQAQHRLGPFPPIQAASKAGKP